MKHSLWKRGAFVFLMTFAIGTGLALVWPAGTSAFVIEREHPRPPDVPDAGPAPKVPCDSECAFERSKNQALHHCYQGGDIPAIGYGFTVVCIWGRAAEIDPRTDEVRWTEDAHK